MDALKERTMQRSRGGGGGGRSVGLLSVRHQHQQQRHYHIKTSHTKVLSSRIILSGNPDFPLTFQVDFRKVLFRWITLSLKYVTSGIILSANLQITSYMYEYTCSILYDDNKSTTELDSDSKGAGSSSLNPGFAGSNAGCKRPSVSSIF